MFNRYDLIRVNDKNSTDMGLMLDFASFTWNSTTLGRTVTAIPDVSGDRQYSDERYTNVTQSFPFLLRAPQRQPILQALSSVSEWLQPIRDYTPIFFSQFPDYFFRGVPNAAPALTWIAAHEGRITVQFDCKPYMYRKDGQQYYTGGSLINAERSAAKPLIHIAGTGDVAFYVNGVKYQINGLAGDAYIDSELEETYDDSGKSLSGQTQFTDHEYPELVHGVNTLSNDDGITKMEVMPRWRKLM